MSEVWVVMSVEDVGVYFVTPLPHLGRDAVRLIASFRFPFNGTVPMKQTNKKTRVEKQESKGERENAPICSWASSEPRN